MIFKEIIMNKILLFKLSTCGPCKLLSKFFTQLHINKEEVTLDKDDNADLMTDKYDIKSVPTVVILDSEGEELGRFVGFKTKEQILGEIYKYRSLSNG